MSSHGNAATSSSSSAPALKTTKPSTISDRRRGQRVQRRERGRDRDRERDQDDQRPLGAADAEPRAHVYDRRADSGLV